MQTKTSTLGCILCLSLLTLFISACAVDNVPVQPTVTLVAITGTPEPPTSTPRPPTPAPPSATPSSSGATLTQALSRAQAASLYRMDLKISGKGNFAPGPITPTLGATQTEATLLAMQGDVNGKDSHFNLAGLFTSFLGVEPNGSLDFITVGDKAYVHGPVPVLNANEAKWYQVPSQQASIAQPPLTPGSFLEAFSSSGINPDDFKKSGTESLDGHTCDVYSGDKSTVVKAFQSLGAAAGASQQDMDAIDNAEFRFLICDDSYLHQVTMVIDGHNKDKPEEKGTFSILMHLYDFDSDIKIQAPPDAEELTVPAFPIPTPTP